MTVRALLLTGTVGAGKSTTADRVADRLQVAGVPHAVIDLDEIRRSWPAPPGDRFGFDVHLLNLAPLADNYVAAGAGRLVLAGVCETRRDRARYEAVLGVPLVVCRLRVESGLLQARLRQRHIDDESGLDWHLARAGELDGILDASGVADLDITVDGLTRDEVALAVLDAIGWTD